MRILGSPIIIGLAIWIFVECWRTFSPNAKAGRSDIKHDFPLQGGYRRIINGTRYRFFLWSLLVFVASLGFELIGARTGKIFGDYYYGRNLEPFLDQVPVAIGFAWLGMLISAIAVVQRSLMERFPVSDVWSALIISLLMVVFDFFMEPAAMRLDYWQWVGGVTPLRNYLAWLSLSFIFSYLGLRLGLFREKMPVFALHAYFAQLLYFVMVNLA